MRAFSFVVLMLVVGCGDDQPATPDAAPDSADDFIGEHPALAIACNDAAADIYVLPTLPAMDDSHRGDVFRCAKSEKLTTNQVKAQITTDNANWPKATPGVVSSGFWTYRIAFRTTRNTVSNARAEGASAAVLLIPQQPLAGAPLIVFGHGSVGFASKCAPSRYDFSGTWRDQDYLSTTLRLVGYGYTVIVPDYVGFAYGHTHGYFNAEDEAHAILDATRAAAKVLTAPPSKVAFVGYSQGGHSVLAAHSYAKAYGMQGELVGVATIAPLWISMSSFGAVPTPAAGYTTANDTSAILYSMGALYSAAELRDGNGEAIFQTGKQAAALEVLTGGECYDKDKMVALGATPSEFFDSTFVSEVGACALQGQCSTTLAQTWRARWIEDRPPIDALGPPILAMFGSLDAFVTPGRASCVQKRLGADLTAVTGATTNVQYCSTANYEHRDMPRGPAADYINEWVAAKAGAGPMPAACTPLSAPACPQIPYDH